MISENSLNKITMRVKAEIENLNREATIITEFEAVTAAAFLYYMESGCDYVVLETGLGGRFDATNVIETPLLSIITSISLDHTKILGDTISKIAFEKCGIIKQNSITVTNSNNHKDALEVIEKSCTEKGSELFVANTADLSILSESIRGTKIEYLEKEYSIPFCGYHQAENAITVITAINCLKSKGIDISYEAIEKGMKNAKNPARCEIVSENPLIIFDGCHNEASANALRLVIDKNLSGKKIVAVIGMMADKAVDTVLDILLPKLSFVCCTTVNNPRAISASELYNKVTEKGVEAAIIEKPCDALNYAKTLSSDLVLVCGSLYLCSELYENKDGMP